MNPRLTPEELGQANARYHNNTHFVVSWMIRTARNCDIHPALLETTQGGYPLDRGMYYQVALAITRSSRFMGAPDHIRAALTRAIQDRRLVSAHYEYIGAGIQSHQLFIITLERILELFEG